MGSLKLAAIVLLLGSPAFAQSSPTYGVGRTPTAEEIRALDISIGPTGEELPQGRGTAKEDAVLFEEKGCVGCHGAAGIGGPAPALKSKTGKNRPRCSRLARGEHIRAHTATARALCDDGMGFH